MQPITRKEMYLNRLAGEQAQAIPAEPITREEQYLGRLCGENNVIPEEPRTRKEIYLANLCGEDVTPPAEAITRIEQYMAFASGERETKPANPLTREEWYWDKYQGGDVPEEKTIAFTDIITVTDALARPAVDLQAEITATQNLNGYEYPWVGGAGKNLFDKTAITQDYRLTATGSLYGQTGYYASDFIEVEVGETYTKNSPIVDAYHRICIYDENQVFKRKVDDNNTITIESGGAYVRFCGLMAEVETTQLEIGSTATAYTPYENICPISGRTEVNVTRTGKNIAKLAENEMVTTGWYRFFPNPIKSTGAHTFSCVNAFGGTGNLGASIAFTNTTTDGTPVGGTITDYTFGRTGGETKTVVIREEHVNAPYICFRCSSAGTTYESIANGKIQIELGSTATAYEPYEGDTFNTELGRTVYGGTLDLTTGELTLTHAYVDLGDLTWTVANLNIFQTQISEKKQGSTNFITTSYRTVVGGYANLANGEATSISPMTHGHIYTYVGIKDDRATTAEDFTTLVTGQKIVYELATPQTISLTPTEVMMLENNNTIWADSGRVQLTYLSKAAQRVQSMNASLKANTLKITKAITGGVEA